jgi:hypothetical protein
MVADRVGGHREERQRPFIVTPLAARKPMVFTGASPQARRHLFHPIQTTLGGANRGQVQGSSAGILILGIDQRIGRTLSGGARMALARDARRKSRGSQVVSQFEFQQWVGSVHSLKLPE